jgi:hypothetical protein
MAIFTIDNSFEFKRKSPIYYTQHNKIYYKSKYTDNFITKPLALFDGTHDKSEFGYDSSATKIFFINNKINKIVFCDGFNILMSEEVIQTKNEFKRSVEETISADDHKVAKSLMATISDRAAELTAEGVDPKEIMLKIWTVPKKNKPKDGNPNNYYTKEVKTFSLDFHKLNFLIKASISPIYEPGNTPTLNDLFDSIKSGNGFLIGYSLSYPDIEEPIADHCDIIIPAPKTE